MQHVDLTAALDHGHTVVCALREAVECADGGPSLQRTLASPAHDRTGCAYTVEVVLRVERFDDG